MDIEYIPEPFETPTREIKITQIPAYKNQPTIEFNKYKPIEHRNETYQFDNAKIHPNEFIAATHSEYLAYRAFYHERTGNEEIPTSILNTGN
jgi:hypothetical protein